MSDPQGYTPSRLSSGDIPDDGVMPPVKKRKSVVPLDSGDFIAQQKARKAAENKPKFISKKEREAIALEKRNKEHAEHKAKLEKNRKETMEKFARAPDGAAEQASKGGGYQQNGQSQRDANFNKPRSLRPGEIPTGPASMRSASDRQSMPPPPKNQKNGKSAPVNDRPDEGEAEAAFVKDRYMGADVNQSTFSAKKKRKRTTEKKFNFEWNLDEDTSVDYNPLYNDRAELSFFGRGRPGGYANTIKDQMSETYAKAIAESDPEHGRERAARILKMEHNRSKDDTRNGIIKHWSEKKLSDMRERDWRIFKEDYSIQTKGGAIPNPMRTWDESGLPQPLLDVVDSVGYTEPSPIQRASIPIALQSRDLIGVAVTGSGKTAAFLLPLLCYIMDMPHLDNYTKNDGPYAIILAPTRELALQIKAETDKFATPLGFRSVCMIGGHSMEIQSNELSRGAEIVIATPGRLCDALEQRWLVLNQCCYVIMDEADRMIDMGFEEPVQKILQALPRYRQTMMYTATMSTAVERIARNYLRRPAQINIGNQGEAVETVEQRVEMIQGEDKRKKRLQEILQSRQFEPPVIVFVNVKANVESVGNHVRKMGFDVVTMSGSKSQDQREAALSGLRSGKAQVLVATDVAGRGLDVSDVSLVVNFNMPEKIDTYTHRIGRTGRAGKTGVAITFLGSEDADVMYDLKQMMSKSKISAVPDALRRHEAAQQKGGNKNKGRGGDDSGGFGGKGGWG
ncbi:hypothetical protein MBLNU230_g5867t1 [Neophaeotheca triangularis]